MTTTITTLQDQLAPLAAKLADILTAKSAIEEEERTIKATIRALVPGPDTYAAGNINITVTTNRRFDPKTAERVLPIELLNLCRVSKVDATAAKVVLPPAVYLQCMAEIGEYRIGFAR